MGKMGWGREEMEKRGDGEDKGWEERVYGRKEMGMGRDTE